MTTKKIFVGSIPGHVTAEALTMYFRFYAPSAVFTLKKKCRNSVANCGFGFVTVETAAEILQILSVQHFIEGRPIKCQERLSGLQLELARNRLNQRRLFLKGFSDSLTDEQLQTAFEQYGVVESAYIVKLYSTQKEKRIAYVTMKDPEIARKLGKLGLMTIYGQMVNISPFHKFEPRTSRFDWEQNQEARFATNYSESSPVYDEGRTHSNWYSNADLPIEIPTNQAACIPDVPVEPPFHLQPNCPLEIRNADKQTIFSLEKDPSATTPTEASQLIEIQSSGSKSVPICPKHCHKFKHDLRPTTRSYCFDKVSSANHGSNNLVLNTNITSIPEANPLLGVSEA